MDGSSIGIDASKMGNEARFINDYRGIAEKPNAIFSDTRDHEGELRMYIWSSQEIKKGDEILVSYGKSWWRTRQGVTNVAPSPLIGNFYVNNDKTPGTTSHDTFPSHPYIPT